MKQLLFILTLIGYSLSAYAQCDQLWLFCQDEIDPFDCVEVGSLTLEGQEDYISCNEEINDLSPLSIIKIANSITIRGTINNDTLALSQLESVDYLDISAEGIKHISLPSLINVNEVILNCPDLQSIEGIKAEQLQTLKIDYISDDFIANEFLSDLKYISRLEIENCTFNNPVLSFHDDIQVDELEIRSTNHLQNLSFLPKIDSLNTFEIYFSSGLEGVNLALFYANTFVVEGSDDLTNLEAFSSLRYSNEMAIRRNDFLVSLSGLENLLITEQISIAENEILSDITAISKVLYNEMLWISGNLMLSECCVVTDLIELDIVDETRIYNNPDGCSSIVNIISKCDPPEFQDEEEEEIKFDVYPNPFESFIHCPKDVELIVVYTIIGDQVPFRKLEEGSFAILGDSKGLHSLRFQTTNGTFISKQALRL